MFGSFPVLWGLLPHNRMRFRTLICAYVDNTQMPDCLPRKSERRRCPAKARGARRVSPNTVALTSQDGLLLAPTPPLNPPSPTSCRARRCQFSHALGEGGRKLSVGDTPTSPSGASRPLNPRSVSSYATALGVSPGPSFPYILGFAPNRCASPEERTNLPQSVGRLGQVGHSLHD
jgi:hypothetical protein